MAYPFGVLGSLAAIFIAKRTLLGTTAADEAPASRTFVATVGERIVSANVVLDGVSVEGVAREVRERHGLRVVFGRLARGGVVTTVSDTTELRRGDVISVVGSAAGVDEALAALGRRADEHLEFDRGEVDFRRVFVSRPEVVERPIRALGLGPRFGAVATRVRRGDIEFVPDDDTELELGDRVRVLAPRERLEEVSRFLGDSYKALSEVDLATFGLGIALGLLLGLVPIPLGGGATFRLGLAGGPLLVGLVLGKLGRSGPLVWTLPFSAGLTLRQLGVVLFLAGVGTRSGWALASTLRAGGAMPLFLLGVALTVFVTVTLLVVGGRALNVPPAMLLGVIAGTQTQPADLSFAIDQAKNEMPTVGYAAVYPLATIAKIVLAQLLLAALGVAR
jgi:putative transport protein